MPAQTSDLVPYPNIYYPNKLNIEQTSSEITAGYKAQLINGNSLLDMTGGLGVDSYYFSKKVGQVTHCEMDKNLSEIAAHNFNVLGVDNCIFEVGDGIEFLRNKKHLFEWIYVDPSRRHNVKGKVFRLEDATPNIPQNLELIFERTNSVLLKTSPLLDLTLATKRLQNVFQIHVVAVQNEVKEVIFILKKRAKQSIEIKTVDLQKDGEVHFGFLWDEEKDIGAQYGLPENYLYEPNTAILKAGGFNVIGQKFGLKKLAPHSHLYTSHERIDFPGRVFKIRELLPYNKKTMGLFAGSKANVTTRNFSETVTAIRKKHNVLDGGQTYLFFTTDMKGEKIVVNCTRV